MLIMLHNTHNRTGVLLSGCNRTEVSCNTISNTFNDWSNDRQAAISSFMGSYALTSCNDVDRTTNGILFNGVAPDADVRGNRIRRHKWGLHLTSTAIIGLQELKGNLWYNAPPLDGLGAWYQDLNNALANPFLYNPALINGGSTQPPSWEPPGWFVPWTFGSNYACAEEGSVDYCSQFVKRGKEQLTDLDVRVALDSLENDPYTEESKWMLKAGLFTKLDENPELQDSLAVVAALFDALQSSATAAFKGIDDGQALLCALDSTVAAAWEARNAQAGSLAMLAESGLEQLGDSTLTPAQRQAILESIRGYGEAIESLVTSNTAELQLALSSKAATADNVRAMNTSVLPNELIESNLKQVNEIYLATIGKDAETFTSDQAAALFDIASQCPMLGGNAVFKARALYSLIDPGQEYDDALICLPFGIDVKRLATTQPNAVSVVPNPAGEEATLVLTRALDEHCSLVIFDALGSEIMRHALPIETVRFSFSTVSMAPALYHYQVRGASGITGAGKLTIVR